MNVKIAKLDEKVTNENLGKTIREIFEQAKTKAIGELTQWRKIDNYKCMSTVEKSIHEMAKNLADEITAAIVVKKVSDKNFITKVQKNYGTRFKTKESLGQRKTSIKLLGGKKVELTTSYYCEKLHKHRGRGRHRGIGKRGQGGKGAYPVLEKLGFIDRVSPCLQMRVAQIGTEVISFEVASQILKELGINLDSKQVRKLTLKTGEKLTKIRNENRVDKQSSLEGKRIVITIDGGRLRTREYKCGRKLENGYHRFATDWKEPKMMVIYEINDEGKKLSSAEVVYDATLESSKFFELLVSQLKSRNAHKAKDIVFIADGGPGIWEIQDKLRNEAHLPITYEILDFFHAAGYLNDAIQVLPYTENEKKTCYKKLRKVLKNGGVESIISFFENFLSKRGRPIKGRNKLLNAIRYFSQHKHRVNFAFFKQQKLPIGSGFVESAIRRVVNLRLKSPSNFWKVENAESMLVLRCALKAGQWNNAMDKIFSSYCIY